MIKQIIAILFLFAFMAQQFSKVVIVGSFYANRGYIAKNLCENRNKPKSCCAGKCQLNKKLNKDTNDDKQNTERKSGKEESEVLSSKSFFASYQPLFVAVTTVYPSTAAPMPTDRSLDIFRPPCA